MWLQSIYCQRNNKFLKKNKIMERRSAQSPSISISPRRRRSEEEEETDDHTSTTTSVNTETTASTTATTANPESIFLTFMESKFHELGRKQQSLIEREHELNQREKALDLQTAQMHFY